MRPLAWAVVALVFAAAPTAAHVEPLAIPGGRCADDGQPHLHLNGFSECASVPSMCLGLPVESPCTPFGCVYADDLLMVRLWHCRSLLPPLPSL